MKRFVSTLTGLILLMASSLSLAQQAPLGMIFQSKGDVQIQRGTEQSKARLADLLYAGDRVVAAPGGEATLVFCPSNERITLKDATVELTAAMLKVIKGTAPARQKVTRCALPQVALGAESLERVGGLRARGHPAVSVYVGGSITTPRPLFEWAPVPDAQSFKVILKNEMGAVVWQHQTSSSLLAYPENLPPLEEKPYQWEVRGEADGKIVAQQTANFEVKINAPLSEQTADDVTELLRAAELENAGYYAEAARIYRKFRDREPSDIRWTSRLAWLYWNAGLIAAANEERKQLEPR